MNLLVEFKNVFFTYQTGAENPVQALQGINLQIREGEFLSLIHI